MSDLRTVRLRSGVETVNGITGETGPVFSEYVLLSDYQALQRDLAAERERADRNQEDAERYRSLIDATEINSDSFTWRRKEKAKSATIVAEMNAIFGMAEE